jgi:hypothetical protein
VETEEVRSQLAQLEQAITREQGLHQQTRRRLQEVEEIHQRVSSSLIEERDNAQRALDQEQSQTERLRGLLAEAKKAPATQPSSSQASPSRAAGGATTAAALPPYPARPASGEGVVVLVTCDIPALVTDIEGLVEKLRRLAHLQRDDLPADQRTHLARGLATLDETVAELLDVYVDE